MPCFRQYSRKRCQHSRLCRSISSTVLPSLIVSPEPADYLCNVKRKGRPVTGGPSSRPPYSTTVGSAAFGDLGEILGLCGSAAWPDELGTKASAAANVCTVAVCHRD